MFKKTLAIILITLLTACTAYEDEQGKAFMLQSSAGKEQAESDRVKEELLKMDEVVSVRGIQHEEDMIMALHIKQKDRFHLKKVRKKAFDSVKALYPNATIHISTDKKIYKELAKAEEAIKTDHLAKSEVKKQLKRIEEHLKE
ncbi:MULTISPECIES: YhcN/YlaJ family sporulation lipoprotein [Shouchella]|uniref:Sporulation lipoprotein YhcN/YlaJ n=2 Tax=Shouchella lehensis TaxID=300825 RepID=A0A060LY18_9BACI|nr:MULTISPECIES: YhcN/YlaJ family sporulation lipoprotein [Bacillaceae]AIC94670.1 hypothetical protein BleG1_2092 [Shouchella lehensis G1]RQW20533.1 hypothetical protein EH196_10510 [Bacillus sp. C1-1]TES50546.1 hypothetical protein E2L03_01030 [Shouchella lehensis]